MDKKNYISPTVSYIGPDINECKEVEAPALVAVGASVVASVATTVTQRAW